MAPTGTTAAVDTEDRRLDDGEHQFDPEFGVGGGDDEYDYDKYDDYDDYEFVRRGEGRIHEEGRDDAYLYCPSGSACCYPHSTTAAKFLPLHQQHRDIATAAGGGGNGGAFCIPTTVHTLLPVQSSTNAETAASTFGSREDRSNNCCYDECKDAPWTDPRAPSTTNATIISSDLSSTTMKTTGCDNGYQCKRQIRPRSVQHGENWCNNDNYYYYCQQEDGKDDVAAWT
jgi:hypothetical protein